MNDMGIKNQVKPTGTASVPAVAWTNQVQRSNDHIKESI